MHISVLNSMPIKYDLHTDIVCLKVPKFIRYNQLTAVQHCTNGTTINRFDIDLKPLLIISKIVEYNKLSKNNLYSINMLIFRFTVS
jgi:hypothetical protein